MKLSLLHKSVNISSHRKGNLMALTTVDQFEFWLKVRDKPNKLSLPWQGPWNLVWVKQVFELSEVELSEFHYNAFSIKNNIAPWGGEGVALRKKRGPVNSSSKRFCFTAGALSWLNPSSCNDTPREQSHMLHPALKSLTEIHGEEVFICILYNT